MKKRKILLGLALASAFVFSLSACGEDDVKIVDGTTDTNPGDQGEGKNEETKSFNISFFNEDGSLYKTNKVNENGQIVEPAKPTKQETETVAYVFDGWYTALEGGTKVESFGVATADANYYARFIAKDKVAVTFISEGNVLTTINVASGDKVNRPIEPSKAGYMFVGWTLNGVIFDFNTPITTPISLVATYEEIKEMENVGFGTGYTAWSTLFENSTRKDSKDRKYLGAEDTSDVEANGFVFKGKALLDSNILNTNASEIVVNLPDNNGSINMTATWGSSSDQGVIKVYNENNEVIYTSSATYSKSNASITLALDGLTKGKYTIKAEKTNTTGQAGLKVSTIYYSQAVKYVTVNYVLGNGDSIDSTTLKKGQKLSSLPSDIIRSGFKFGGWYTSDTFDEDSAFDINKAINETITLYAKWIEITEDMKTTVSFVVPGHNIDPIEVEKGSTLTTLPSINIDGYRFNGWYLDNEFKKPFTLTTTIDDTTILYAQYIKTYDVTFLGQDGELIKTVTVDNGKLVGETIKTPYIEGMKFDHWVIEGTSNVFEILEDVINSKLTVRAVYVVDETPVEKVALTSATGGNESAVLLFSTYANAEGYNIYLDEAVEKDRLLDEKNVYIQIAGNKVRADLIGLKAGSYTVRVVPIIDGTELFAGASESNILVDAYDRSGYAHFNNQEGVGAYNDDGTLKDNAIVLYVTDENKNTVELTYGGITVQGIGNILNSVGEACGEAGHEGECKKVSDGKTYYGTANTNQGVLLKLAEDNIPLAVRFVGCVSDSGLYAPGTFAAKTTSKINGLTEYNNVNYGGSVGDNGHMARMKSAKNITLEGIGSEATIDGWGFHLICETAHPDLAKNFEVRNLAFINTPEDAIGMEGQETESTLTITASVERCWIHHNTFISPSISDPAESDKGEGDGSCDFKRGRYFTCSYNYFENCHKTNLVGSSKTSVQYCLTYHHNIWYNCAARQPLARRANIHFYNNLIIGTTDTVASLRADSYMFAESNYYMGCSRPVECKAEGTAGVCKSFENVLVGCYNDYSATVAKTRDEQVSSSCKDNGTNISYVNFDTNPEIFYYDSANKKSDCYLTDANQARIDCLEQAGSAYRRESAKTVLTTDTKVTNVESSADVSGTGSLTFAKAKGVIKVFTVKSPVELTIAATSDAGFDTGYLLRLDGSLVLALKDSEQKVVLENGVYVLSGSVSFTGGNGKNDKETTITTFSYTPFDSEELNQKQIAKYNEAHDAIPANITYTTECYNLINAAISAYESLGNLQSRITNYSDVLSALATYKALGVQTVEEAIDAIGTVNENSGSLISNARNLYDTLITRCPDAKVSNYSTLTAAENDYKSYAVNGCINAINAIGTVTLDSENLIVSAETIYDSLTDAQKALITNYSTLTDARAKYDSLVKVDTATKAMINSDSLTEYEAAYSLYSALSATEKNNIDSTIVDGFMVNYAISLIDTLPTTISLSDANLITKIGAIYDSLSADNKAKVTNSSKYLSAKEAYEAMASQALDCTFAGSPSNSAFSVSGKYGNTAATIAGVAYTQGLKMESSTSVTFTTSSAKTMTLHVTAGKKIKIDNVSYSVPTDGVLTIQLSAGSHTIAKDTTNTLLYYVQLV